MRYWATGLLALGAALALAPPALAEDDAPEGQPAPAALVLDGIPAISPELVERTRPYMEYRTASFAGWNPADRSMLISTRFGDVSQLHNVRAPGAARSQMTFEPEPVYGGDYAPDGGMLIFGKDTGGNEVFQIYALEDGRTRLLTDGKSRNSTGPWREDGSLIAYGSNARTGVYNDIYVMDPRDPSTARMLFATESGGWFPIEFTPDGKQLLVFNYLSVTDNQLHLVDVATGTMRQVTRDKVPVAYGDLQFGPDGRLWATADSGADLKRLGTIDLKTGAFQPMIDGGRWDVEEFELSDDGKTLAYVLNAAGMSELYVRDVASGETRRADLPPGVIGSMDFAPWGELGFSFTSNRAASDAYSLKPDSMTLTRWTVSETGGLDPEANVLPELVEIKSFDGEPMSGFLYRPDPAKHPGKRPLIVAIHGGPEGQSTASFQGRNNYLINELGIALFYPNVRGSTGFGKRFVALDNGPFRREDSVKDIGAFLDALAADPGIDAGNIGVAGGSYGGYMCYASAIFYGDRLDAANCIVAISSFVTFLENTEEYRRDLRRVEYGDERVPEQREKLQAISPLTRVDEIGIPLLVVTGANDPRVPASEADQIIAAVRGNQGIAWHMLAKNEGHGYRKKENIDFQFWTQTQFWEDYLLKDGPDAAAD